MKSVRFFVVLGTLALGIAVAQQSGNTSASEKPMRVRVSQRVSGDLLIKKVQPRYPEDARRNRIQGDVVMTALIDKNGDVKDLKLNSGDPALVLAATEAVKQWKYRPYLLNGYAVEVETQITVSFTLEIR